MPVTATPRPTGHPGYSETLPRKPQSALLARRFVRTALAAWGLEELVDDASLIITELVSNAANHSRLPSIRVIVSRTSEDRVRLGVVDRSKDLPTMRTNSNGEQIRGRGLLIVDALTEQWGTELYPWGKQVWGEIQVRNAS
ncbi:ATP-binding protein [Streptomyces parvus]|uniref:ATP-binding protein n=1 Tax=Streptomyces parvus TaxID=66428 RepID=UPI00363531A4